MVRDLDEVARLAGVSTATVSRALRGLPNVREETRRRVQEAAREVGYAPSPSAASLASGRTRTIGLLTPWVRRWFHGCVIEGAERELRRHGFDLLLYSFDLDETKQHRPDVDPAVLRRRVDGVVVAGMVLREEEIAALGELEVPIVFVGSGPAELPTVRLDDDEVGALAATHLADLGHTVVGHLGGPEQEWVPWSAPLGRQRGFEAVAAARGFDPDPALRLPSDFSPAGGRAAMSALLDVRPDITAVVVDSDEMAFGAWEELRRRGVAVPEQVSVVSIDGVETGALIGLSSFAQDPIEQGREGARMVLRMLAEGAPVPSVMRSAELVDRGSTAPPALR